MNKLGYIYLTIEKNSDDTELFHNNLKKIGIGRTNDISRRFVEHATRGSKATVGVDFIKYFDCDELSLSDFIVEDRIHKILNDNFINIDRISHIDEFYKKSTTEVYSGRAKRTIDGVFEKGEQLSIDLFMRIVKNISNVDIFKSKLSLLPHQIKSYLFILDRFSKGVKDVLLNHKPRAGKSFICYHYMIDKKPQNVLLLTQYPILNGQWKSEFENLRDHDYNIINAREVKKVELSKDRPNLVMISLQDAKGDDLNDSEIVEGLKKQKFSQLKKVDWDLLIFDEVHKGKETEKTDKLLSGLNYKNLLGLSATATKNLLRGSFELENVDRYTLTEENEYKKLYPEIYKNPSINNYLFNIDDNVKKTMKYFEKEEGFTFSKFFEVENNSLVYKNDVISLFEWFFCKGKYNRKSKRKSIINESESLLFFVENNACQTHIKEMLTNMLGDVYDVYFTNSDVNSSEKLLHNIKTEYVPKGSKKVIIIANKQLTTGITLKYCDVVVFMNDWKSVDEYIQASYRCQSPTENKEKCYTIDLNPGRAYNILHSYIESNSSFKKYDINDSISEYLDCAPIFETYNNELKEINFEDFKKRITENSGIDRKFFPKSILNSDTEILKEKELLLGFGELESVVKTGSEKVKLDDEQPDSGKNKNKKRTNNPKEQENRETEEYKSILEMCIKNAEFLLERLPILSLVTEFKCDNIDSVFEMLDESPKMIDLLISELMIENKLK